MEKKWNITFHRADLHTSMNGDHIPRRAIGSRRSGDSLIDVVVSLSAHRCTMRVRISAAYWVAIPIDRTERAEQSTDSGSRRIATRPLATAVAVTVAVVAAATTTTTTTTATATAMTTETTGKSQSGSLPKRVLREEHTRSRGTVPPHVTIAKRDKHAALSLLGRCEWPLYGFPYTQDRPTGWAAFTLL